MLLLILLSACSIIGGTDQNNELDLLTDQVDALSTQNAILMQNQNDQAAPQNTASQNMASNSTETPTAFVIPTATPESLPGDPVMAGVPIIYDGWSMMLSKNITTSNFNDYGPTIAIEIIVRNLEEDNRIFRFSNSSITMKDNLGNEFPAHDGYRGSCEPYYYGVKNITISGNGDIDISSRNYGGCEGNDGIQKFIGPIPLKAGHLIVRFENFGPFSGVDVIIDL